MKSIARLGVKKSTEPDLHVLPFVRSGTVESMVSDNIPAHYSFRRATVAQIERSLKAAKRSGTPAQSITHHPDGRVVIQLKGIGEALDEVNEWDTMFG